MSFGSFLSIFRNDRGFFLHCHDVTRNVFTRRDKEALACPKLIFKVSNFFFLIKQIAPFASATKTRLMII